MAKPSLKDIAYKQQEESLIRAHTQALKLLLQSQLPPELTVSEALSYSDAVKSKLGPVQFEEFMEIMRLNKKPNCDPHVVITKMYHLLKNYPELLVKFGMFLPPSVNLQLQTQGHILFQDSCTENISSSLENNSTNDDSACTDVEVDVSKSNSVEVSNDALACTEIQVSTDFEKESDVSRNEAVSFLSKVKERFKTKPELYEQFLLLLYSIKDYNSTDQRERIEFSKNTCLEICKLFEDHEDLIEDFKAYVPGIYPEQEPREQISLENSESQSLTDDPGNFSDSLCDESVYSSVFDPSAAPVYKYGAYEEHLFFDRVRAALGYPEVYDNFLRCLMLFNEDIITKSELLKLATSFLG